MEISSEYVNHGCVIQLTNERNQDRPAENRDIYQNVVSGSILGTSYRISCVNTNDGIAQAPPTFEEIRFGFFLVRPNVIDSLKKSGQPTVGTL